MQNLRRTLKARQSTDGPKSLEEKINQELLSRNVKKPLGSETKNSMKSLSKPNEQTSKLKVNNLKSSHSRTSITPRVQKSNDRIPTEHKPINKDMTGIKNVMRESKSDSFIQTPRVQKKQETNKNTQRKVRTGKDLPVMNVTVNSPVLQRKPLSTQLKSTNSSREATIRKYNKPLLGDGTERKAVDKIIKGNSTTVEEKRERSNTRTLNDNEIKIFSSQNIDNNFEIHKLTKNLVAKPKTFFVDLEDKKSNIKFKTIDTNKKEFVPNLKKAVATEDVAKVGDDEAANEKSSDEVSYEDDFESYESDFESYHSSDNDTQNTNSKNNHTSLESDPERDENYVKLITNEEEKKLDSGNFELREFQKSASKVRPMDDIMEHQDDKSRSLTDEGFLDMSNSSGIIPVKNRTESNGPVRMDLKTAKENRRKKALLEKLAQRAKDILSMITLHEVSYSIFEMKPIPYDTFMDTFGKSNNVQVSTQTFDDGIIQETQTEEINTENKWTQDPVKFSNAEVYITEEYIHTCSHDENDLVSKLSFMFTQKESKANTFKVDDAYRTNQLRIYLDQKDGVGGNKMLPYEQYQKTVNNPKYDIVKLRRFLFKAEKKIKIIINDEKQDSDSYIKTSKWRFSGGYKKLLNNVSQITELQFLHNRTIDKIVTSKLKPELIITVHPKGENTPARPEKCLLCLWNINFETPLKIMVSIENVSIGKLHGNSSGIFFGALDDGSIHVWDLSEDVHSYALNPNESNSRNPVRYEGSIESISERREGNTDIGSQEKGNYSFQSCAYTSSAFSLAQDEEKYDVIVGLEVVGKERNLNQNGIRILCQICSLLRKGVIKIWVLMKEKHYYVDIGKAYWSKIRLQHSETIDLSLYLHLPVNEVGFCDGNIAVNLQAAKRRIAAKRSKDQLKDQENLVMRPKPVLPVTRSLSKSWESGVLCTGLMSLKVKGVESYMIGKNRGEILLCAKSIPSAKVKTIKVTNDCCTITCLEKSSDQIHVLVGSDQGHVSMVNLVSGRVLLTLDSCTGIPKSDIGERYVTDHKGRFKGSVAITPTIKVATSDGIQDAIKCIHWSSPCCFVTLTDAGNISYWDLAQSDLFPKYTVEDGSVRDLAMTADNKLIVLLQNGQVELHDLVSGKADPIKEQLFNKYVALL